MVKRLIYILAVAFVFPLSLSAQEIQIEYPEGVLGKSQFNITFSISGSQPTDLTLSSGENINILNKNRPSFGSFSKITDVNGIYKQVSTYSYTFKCKPTIDEGIIKLPIFTCKQGQTKLSSNSRTIQVVPDSYEKNRVPFIPLLELTRPDVIIGEELYIDLVLLYSVGLNQVDHERIQNIEGISITEQQVRYNESSTAIFNKKIYNKATIKRFTVKCNTEGTFTIPSISLSAVPTVGQDKGVRLTKITTPLTFKVISIPEDKPANYIGIFSDLELLHLQKDSVFKSDQAIPLNFTLKGKGDFSDLVPPNLSELKSQFEVYGPEIKEAYVREDFQQIGSANLNYTLVPKKAGELGTPSLYISFFNRKTLGFDSLKLESFKLNITKSQASKIEEIQVEEPLQITPIPMESLLSSGGLTMSSSAYLGALAGMLGMFFLIFGAVKLAKRKKKKIENEPDLTGLELFQSELSSLKPSTNPDFSNQLLESFEDYLLHVLKLNKAGFNKADLKDHLPEELCKQVTSFMKTLEMNAFSKFTPETTTHQKDTLIKQAESLTQKLSQL